MTASALVVINPFGGYSAGNLITDPAAIAAILASDNAASVVATVPGSGSAAVNNLNAPYRQVTTLQSGAIYLTNFNKETEVMLATPVACPIYLPTSPALYAKFAIKDGLGNFQTYPATVTDPGGALIDGAATFVMNVNYERDEFEWQGTQWRVN